MTAEAETIHTTLTDNPELASVTVKGKPSRSFMWIGAGIVSLILLLIAAFGAFRLFTPSIRTDASTVTPSPEIIPSETPTLPTETVDLPNREGMVKIESGTYELGISQADEFHSAIQSISLNDSWIDQYQITNAQYQQFLEGAGGQPPIIWPGQVKNPVRGVTWDQARAYCSWANKRLPSEAEWEVAGRGPGSNPQLYPWGNDPTDGGKALEMPDQDTYEIGTQSFNVSPLGVYDLVGNVWEWVGESYGSIQSGYKVLRGGRFGIPQDLAYRLTVASDDDRYIKYAGFRCAADQVK